jgi:hypothetical protein
LPRSRVHDAEAPQAPGLRGFVASRRVTSASAAAIDAGHPCDVRQWGMGDSTSDAGRGDASSASFRAERAGEAPVAPAFVRTAFATEESVYGVLLVDGMIVVSAGHGASAWAVFATVLGTVVVFWAAHVYAGTVAHHGLDHERMIGLGEAFRGAVRRSMGLLASALVPSFILLLGATRAIPDVYAIWTALWAGVVVLAVLGWVAFARRGSPWPIRVGGALGTAAFGIAMILMKALIH